MCFCKGGNLERSMGLCGTFSEMIWKVQTEGEMQRKKINLIVDSHQNMSVMEHRCEKRSCVKAKVRVESGEQGLKVSKNSKVYFLSKLKEEKFFLPVVP